MLLQILFCIVIAVLAVPVSVLAIQIFAALTHKKKSLVPTSHPSPSLAILMPAHNESLVIAETIKALIPALKSADQILVVADNCNDETASIARNLGATVIERQHATLRGKGYALDFGLQYLKASPPEVVIVIDADCMVDTQSISALASACVLNQRPIQALYLMQAQPDPSLKQRIAAFAWLVKNYVRPLGFNALGLPCQLMGTGMAFLWQDINAINLASAHIAEDMKMGVDLARINKAPIFLPQALVTSTFPSDQNATKTQRARWEHGHLSVITNDAPVLFIEAIASKNLQMFGLALDLIVPPLAVLTLICAFVWVMSFALYLLTKLPLSLTYASLVFIVLSLAVLCAWAFFGRHIISLKQLCYAPVYALVKIPLYIKFFVNRQVEWVRSKRD
jgi:cellulose synthase/poly-beta-1,6-N-acetylglucosamine synthase-like glycosyltransferase